MFTPAFCLFTLGQINPGILVGILEVPSWELSGLICWEDFNCELLVRINKAVIAFEGENELTQLCLLDVEWEKIGCHWYSYFLCSHVLHSQVRKENSGTNLAQNPSTALLLGSKASSRRQCYFAVLLEICNLYKRQVGVGIGPNQWGTHILYPSGWAQ